MAQLQNAMEKIQSLFQPESSMSALNRVCDSYGFTNLAYFGLPRFGSLQTPPRLRVTYKDEWVNHYTEKRYATADPVLLEGMKTKNSLDWGSLDRNSGNRKVFFGEASEFGIGKNGLTIPIMGQGTPIALVSFTSNETDEAWRQFAHNKEQELHLVSMSLHEHVWQSDQSDAQDGALTDRETECLKWAAVGKTAYESSVIIGLSERTVRHHLEMSRKKLDATNITHAVVKAINANMLGLNF